VAGLESLPANYTITAVLGQISLKALDGLMDSYESMQTPFSLQCHFEHLAGATIDRGRDEKFCVRECERKEAHGRDS
jgi:hypothetical protein